jgi:hypothetical protein
MKLVQLFEETSISSNNVKNAYIEAIYFTDVDNDNDITYDDEFSDEAIKNIEVSIQKFLINAESELDYAQENSVLPPSKFWEQVGHDLWLTRNGHGAGFWDDPEYYGGEKNVKILTDKAHELGEINLYKGDDGLLYFS